LNDTAHIANIVPFSLCHNPKEPSLRGADDLARRVRLWLGFGK